MPAITFEGESYTLRDGESILDGLLRHGIEVPSSCRSGICQSCLLKAETGTLPAESQAGLKPTLQAQGYFMACKCSPAGDLVVSRPGSEAVSQVTATVVLKERLADEIVRIQLHCREPFAYRAGQFMHLQREDGLVRSYSLASVPGTPGDGALEIHVRRLPNGKMTQWIHDTLAVGDPVKLSGPAGNCFYLADRPDQPILLICTGSGLAPLWGITHDALANNHTGPISLYHGSWTRGGLYLVDEMRQLEQSHNNFRYFPCVDDLEGCDSGDVHLGRADQKAFSDHRSLGGYRVFICGHPEMVAGAKKKAFLLGASMKDIFADPFVLSRQV